MTTILLCLFLTITILSCDDGEIRPVKMEDGLYAVDRHGLVENYSPDLSKKKIYAYMVTGCINEWLNRTPRGKIDKIMSENPDWELLVYVNGDVEDTTKVRKKLDQYDCDFPVILDTKGEFCKRNRMKDTVLWGTICDRNGVVRGVGVIGDGMSMFDSEFERVKRRANGRF